MNTYHHSPKTLSTGHVFTEPDPAPASGFTIHPKSFKLMSWAGSGEKKKQQIMKKSFLRGIHFVDISGGKDKPISKKRLGQIEKVSPGDFVHMYHGTPSQTANGKGVHYHGVALTPYKHVTDAEKSLFVEMSLDFVDIHWKIKYSTMYCCYISWEEDTLLTQGWRNTLVQQGCGTVIPLKVH